MAFLARSVCGLLALLFATALPASALAGDVQLIEQKIKAGLIYNFLKYTQWPATAATAATTVCQFGGDAFDGHLAPMAGRTVNQSAIEIRVALTANDAAGCSLLFLPADKKATWSDLKKALAGKAVLTVSDFGDFTAAGGMIEFTRDDDRIGVRINVDAVAAAHLTVEDRLLKLASAVHASPER